MPTKTKPRPAASEWDVCDRAACLASGVLYEYGAEQFDSLTLLPDAVASGPMLEGLRLAVRALAYEVLVHGGRVGARAGMLTRRFPGVLGTGASRTADETVIFVAADKLSAPQALAAILEIAAVMELQYGPNRTNGEDLLAWAELDWAQLQAQARRELAGGETAEAKVAAAESEAAPAKKPRKGKAT